MKGDGGKGGPSDAGVKDLLALRSYVLSVTSLGDRVDALRGLLLTLCERMSSQVDAQDGRRRVRLPRAMAVAVCCASRDTLDQVAEALAGLPRTALCVLHGDLGVERVRGAAEEFREWETTSARVTAEAAGDIDVHVMTREDIREHNERLRQAWLSRPLLHAVAASDVCLSAWPGSLGVNLLLHFDLPAKRDVLRKREAAMLSVDPAAVEVRAMLEDEGERAARVEVLMATPEEEGLVGQVTRGKIVEPLPIDVQEMFS